MAEVDTSVEIAAPLADVWELYFDPERWGSWVDGFSSVTSSEGYPETAGVLRWTSTPVGRGAVSERVLEHEPRRLHRVEFTDPGAEGELEVRFEMVPGGEADRRTKVTQRVSYRLSSGGPLRGVTDRFFIRPQMRGSLERSLAGLRAEAEAGASSSST